MWGVVRTAILSALVLILMHQIYNHLQATLTVPRVADLVNRPEKKYADIDTILNAKKPELSTFLSELQR